MAGAWGAASRRILDGLGRATDGAWNGWGVDSLLSARLVSLGPVDQGRVHKI